jgi:hypothetical protein
MNCIIKLLRRRKAGKLVELLRQRKAGKLVESLWQRKAQAGDRWAGDAEDARQHALLRRLQPCYPFPPYYFLWKF